MRPPVDASAGPVTPARLGFGCAGLMRLPSRRKRQDLLAAVLDAEIRHFDVARMYGLGAAEGELGRFVRGKRDQVTIATKFGIVARTEASVMARLQGPARAVLGRYPALRRTFKRRHEAFHRTRRYDLVTAKSSLERSLTELGTDYVDILFIHDPLNADDVALGELQTFLEDSRQAGLVRSWGISGENAPVMTLALSCPQHAVVQVRDDIFTRQLGEKQSDHPRITFGLLESALPIIVDHVNSSSAVRKRWNETLGNDCTAPGVIASLLLGDGLQSNPKGMALFSAGSREKIATASATETSSSDDLAAFQALIRTELRQPT